MTKTVFAGEEVEKFALPNGFAVGTHFFTILPWFPKHFFMGNRPCYTSYGHGQQKQIKYLQFDCWVHAL